MKNLKLLTLLLILSPLALNAQSLECPRTLKLLSPSRTFSYNNLSKSAQCYTGKKYEFLVPLMKGRDYRISFFASAVFNNKINFRIIDNSSGKKVLDLPGEVPEAKKGTCVLCEYLDESINRMVHPYFDFNPSSSTTLKIIIDIASKPQETRPEGAFASGEDRDKGCVTVFIQDKAAEKIGF